MQENLDGSFDERPSSCMTPITGLISYGPQTMYDLIQRRRDLEAWDDRKITRLETYISHVQMIP